MYVEKILWNKNKSLTFFLPALALGILSCLWCLGQYTASYSKSITFSCISRIMCSSGSRNPSLKPGGCTPLSGLCRDTLFFTHLSLTGNKVQTAVINIRKYKRILYFLMFIPAVCFLFLLYGDVPLNRVWFVFSLRLRSMAVLLRAVLSGGAQTSGVKLRGNWSDAG